MSLEELSNALEAALIQTADTEDLEAELERREERARKIVIDHIAEQYADFLHQYSEVVQDDPENPIEERAYEERVEMLRRKANVLPSVKWVPPEDVSEDWGDNAREEEC